MPHYWYKLITLNQDALDSYSSRYVICNVSSIDEVTDAVMENILNKIRGQRFMRLLEKFLKYHNLYDESNLRNYLPKHLKAYANDISRLKENMASMNEILESYIVYDIERAPDCYACIYNWSDSHTCKVDQSTNEMSNLAEEDGSDTELI